MQIIYRCKNDCKTIFTADNVKAMLKFEGNITNQANFKNLCYLADQQEGFASNGSCPDSAYSNITNRFLAKVYPAPAANVTKKKTLLRGLQKTPAPPIVLTDVYVQSLFSNISNDPK